MTLANAFMAYEVAWPFCSLEVATIISLSGFAKSISSIRVKTCPPLEENLLPFAKTGK